MWCACLALVPLRPLTARCLARSFFFAVRRCCRRWCRVSSLFWSQEMEIAVLGLGNAGKSSFVHVINVRRERTRSS